MKIYNTELDEYGWAIDSSDYIMDKQIPSGFKWEIYLEMKIWNFIARIVNLFHQEESKV